MRINHNIAALNTHRQLNSASTAQSKSMEKLSSGLRINNAADDAAGLAISEKMRGQIRGLDMASKNAQDATSLIQTAEGALNETHDILQRMRELSVQAANDTATPDDREKIQDEINQLTSEINRIGNTTEFNTKKLLNGDAGNKVEVGNESVLGSVHVTAGTTAAAQNVTLSISAGDKHILTTTDADGVTNGENGAVQKDGATGVNFAVANLGTDLDTLFGTSAFSGDESFTITQGTGANAKSATVTVSGTDTLQQFIDKVNSKLQDEGIKASMTIDPADANGLQLIASEGGTANELTVVENNFDGASFGFGNTAEHAGAQAASDFVITGDDGTDTSLDSASGSISLNDGTQLDIEIAGVGSSTVGIETNKLDFQIGANENQAMTLSISDMRASALGISGSAGTGNFAGTNGVTDGTSSSTTEAGLDVSTHAKAASSITAIDEAIKEVSTERSKLGSVQNRLEHTINNLGTSAENLTAAESRIRDVDMAKEMMEQTKNSILSQAAQAMLAQSNQMPQGVLQLLR